MDHRELLQHVGPIDIYLFDQIMKGRFVPPMSILDAGCGGGRNLVYFLQAGFDVHGVDESDVSIADVRRLAAAHAPQLPPENFVTARVEALPYANGQFDAVISSAVLHFAKDDAQFTSMLNEMWRVLKPKGLFFARLTSSTGIESRVRPIEGRVHQLPDGSQRYLVDQPMLMRLTEQIGGRFLDPIKTVNVQNQRCMTTWVLRKLA